MENKVRLNLNPAQLAFVAVVFFTFLQGFFNSLSVEFSLAEKGTQTFLFDPGDLHADLVEIALASAPNQQLDTSRWPDLYQHYYKDNSYDTTVLISGGEPHRITALHTSPILLVTCVANYQLIRAFGPAADVALHYILAFGVLWLICAMILRNWRDRLIAFGILAISYPFLMILTRGNQGSLVTGGLLITFLFLVCTNQRPLLAAICLAVACNFRPNAIFFAPLFFCFGVPRALRAIPLFVLTGMTILGLCYIADTRLYPGYNVDVVQKALAIYYKLYVLGSSGAAFNNSAYGAFVPIYSLFHAKPDPSVLRNAGIFFSVAALLALAYAWLLYLRGILSKLEFAFVCTALYTLGSTVFVTYHLLPYAFFLLYLYRENARRSLNAQDFILLLTSTCLLIPKNYIFIHHVSFEVVINPMILLMALAFIFWQAAPAPKAAT